MNDINEPMPPAINIEAAPRPREVKFYFKDVVEASRQHQRKHVEKIGKEKKEYRANKKDILALRRVLKKYNNTIHKPTEKFIN